MLHSQIMLSVILIYGEARECDSDDGKKTIVFRSL